MSLTLLRRLIDDLDIDGHAFATAYINHVETTKAVGDQPIAVSRAAHNFVLTGSI